MATGKLMELLLTVLHFHSSLSFQFLVFSVKLVDRSLRICYSSIEFL